MSGARFTIDLQAQEALAALERVRQLGRQPRSMLRAIGVGLVANTQDRFDAEQDPDGNSWAPLLPAYAPLKRGPGILREAGMRGGLQGSITSEATDTEVVVGSNKIYAAVHQFGATIRPKRAKALRFQLAGGWVSRQSVFIPARPYLGLSEADRDTMLDVTEAFVSDALRGLRAP